MIFQPGWTGHVRCALLQSLLRSTNNVPSSPSLQSVASLAVLETASIAHTELVGWLVCYPTWSVAH